jgi:hypothetical protein
VSALASGACSLVDALSISWCQRTLVFLQGHAAKQGCTQVTSCASTVRLVGARSACRHRLRGGCASAYGILTCGRTSLTRQAALSWWTVLQAVSTSSDANWSPCTMTCAVYPKMPLRLMWCERFLGMVEPMTAKRFREHVWMPVDIGEDLCACGATRLNARSKEAKMFRMRRGEPLIRQPQSCPGARLLCEQRGRKGRTTRLGRREG